MSLNFISPSRTVLILGDEAVHVYGQGSKGVTYMDSIAWSRSEFEDALAEVLRKDCKSRPVLVLYDMVEQYYRKERMPKVGVLDKASVLQRKLRVIFPQYHVRAALKLNEKPAKPQGKQGGQAAGDVYLCAAIPASEQYKKVMEAVKRSMVSIAGLCMLPIESSDFVKTLAAKTGRRKAGRAKWAVFIGQHKNGGLRQIVTKNGELALTRMTSVTDSDADPDVWASEVLQEFSATMSYLTRFGYAQEDGLEVIVVANPEAGELISEKIQTPCHLTTCTASEAARLAGIKIEETEDERYADTLHAAWSSRKARLLLPMVSREISGVHKPRQVAMIAMGLLLCGMIYLGAQLYLAGQSLLETQEEIDDAQASLNRLEAEYQEEVARKEAMGFDVELVQGSLNAYEAMLESDVNALEFFKDLGVALGVDLTLETLDVQKNKEAENLIRIVQETGRGEDRLEGAPAYEAVLSMKLPASLEAQEAIDLFESFQERVEERFPDHRVEVVQSPGPTSYNIPVEGEAGMNETERVEDYLGELKIWKPLR